jgi:predicted RNA-binding Zn ribbon-like protein
VLVSTTFGLTPAPGGLRFVQDLINTSITERAYDRAGDRLADLATARTWLRQALDDWAVATDTPAPLISLGPDDLATLQELRERLRAALRADAANAPALPRPQSSPLPGGEVRLLAAPDGRMRYQPAATDGRAVADLVAAESLLAQTTGAWANLKTCANGICGVAFYDSSPNRSRAWHNTKTCGNISNLRASRSRRKAG